MASEVVSTARLLCAARSLTPLASPTTRHTACASVALLCRRSSSSRWRPGVCRMGASCEPSRSPVYRPTTCTASGCDSPVAEDPASVVQRSCAWSPSLVGEAWRLA